MLKFFQNSVNEIASSPVIACTAYAIVLEIEII
jgi:hypothetical protein